MTWEIDGRRGTAAIGGAQRKGFALMRDRDKRILAFHLEIQERSFDPLSLATEPRAADQFAIGEDAFRAHVAESVLGGYQPSDAVG